MTLSLLSILAICCLAAILAIVLLLWRRESRKLADSETRERDAATRLSAAEVERRQPSRF